MVFATVRALGREMKREVQTLFELVKSLCNDLELPESFKLSGSWIDWHPPLRLRSSFYGRTLMTNHYAEFRAALIIPNIQRSTSFR